MLGFITSILIAIAFIKLGLWPLAVIFMAVTIATVIHDIKKEP